MADALSKRIYDIIFKLGVCFTLTDSDVRENDLSALTAKEVVDKIRDFLAQNPSDVNEMILLRYLAEYPVSMCKRDVSPLLRLLIGFHYRFGVPTDEERDNGAERVSYDDLNEIFVRSKSTVSECVNETENDWRELQSSIEEAKRIEADARKQRIEEEKERLKQLEQNKEGKTQTNERTVNTPTEEV